MIPNLKFSEMGGGSGVNFGDPKSEVFQDGGLGGGVFRSKLWSSLI